MHPAVNDDKMQTFLEQHIEKDLTLLSNRIAKNNEDTNTAVHILLKRLLLNDKKGTFYLFRLFSFIFLF